MAKTRYHYPAKQQQWINMKGSEKVIERLNHALHLELGAVNQYWLHYRLAEDWGLIKIAAKEREESIEEMHHADKIIERIIFLGGHPNLQNVAPLRIGQNVKELLEADLAGELEALKAYNEAKVVCEQEGDFISERLFKELIADEEHHLDFLETQLDMLARLGEQNYALLQSGDATET